MLYPSIVLASASPRRRQLLGALGLTFEIIPAEVDESPLPLEAPHTLACRLALEKALKVAPHFPGALIIAADTLVVLEGQILGKPASPEEAAVMLKCLRGRRHLVDSGLALLWPSQNRRGAWLAETPVWMRSYSDEEIRRYVATGDPLDKAGAYAVQHEGFAPVERLEGCYANVVGLPLCHLYRILAAWGLTPPRPPLEVCPWAVEHRGCEWAEAILQGDWIERGVCNEPRWC